ncbi:MAG: long-chain fatty acid--CoA ligase, partial [Phycisphaeraceae bacterium]
PHIMAGYFKMPELTEQVIDSGGFFTTGDWGKIDEDGYVFITGRKKEMLIVSGENLFPREIEEVLNAHESVHESAVIGQSDPMRGEVPIAFLELAEGAELDEKALRDHCREYLAQWKVPREFRVVDKLPRGATGKVLRRALSA